MPTPNVGSSSGFHINQPGRSSYVPTAASPTSSPASSNPSISDLRIRVSGTPIATSIDSAIRPTSQNQNVDEILEFDRNGRLIIAPDHSEGFIPSKAAGKNIIA